MLSRRAWQCWQRPFNRPKPQKLLTYNLDLMPALRTRVLLAGCQYWSISWHAACFHYVEKLSSSSVVGNELPTVLLAWVPVHILSRALTTTSPTSRGWHINMWGKCGVLAAEQHGEGEVTSSRALTASKKCLRTVNTLPAFALSKPGLAPKEVKN